MSNLVIVAIPEANDRVWKVSTEKKPHCTLLFLGEGTNPDRGQIAEFMLHAANMCLTRFMLDVDRRGELGPDKADVLFFENVWDLPKLKQFRDMLLKNDAINKAYNSVEQYPVWTPHLTLGYPTAPARDDKVDYPISYVNFDTIGLWDQDYEGFELVLKRDLYPLEEVAMSGVVDAGRGAVEDVIKHYGVKGMKWGVRKEGSSSEVTVQQKGRKLKSSGGADRGPHPDAVRARTHLQVAKKSGVHALSNEELQQLQTRMNLEQNVSGLASRQPKGGVKVTSPSPAKKFIANLLVNAGKQQAQRVVNDQAGKQVDKMLKKKEQKK